MIDAALQAWNGSVESKRAVVRHFKKYGLDDAADFLKAEYGNDLPAFPVVNANYELPWRAVQKRIQYLIERQKFFTEEEYDNFEDVDPVTIREGIARSTFGEQVEQDVRLIRLSEDPGVEFHLPPDFELPRSQAAKFEANIEAIRLMKQISAEGRRATAEEQSILAKYTGWGGIPQAFDETNASWSDRCRELRELLTDGEYKMTRGSTLNAHYTDPTIIRAIYDYLLGIGFQKGRILEPGMGVGYFFGAAPASMEGCHRTGVELDHVSGRIAQLLYPSADIRVQGFETVRLPNNKFDLAIGNVPFGNYIVSDEHYSHFIHDYFLLKSLDLVRPGGLMAFITSKGTLDKENPAVRKKLAHRAELLGAVRLPSGTFREVANTEVVSDLLIFQKRTTPMEEEPEWVYLGYSKENSEMTLNQYFISYPEMVLGNLELVSNRFNKPELTVTAFPGRDLDSQLRKALSRIPGQYLPPESTHTDTTADQDLPLDEQSKPFTYCLVGDSVYYNNHERLVFVGSRGMQASRLKGFVRIKEAVYRLINYQLERDDDRLLSTYQEDLRRVYDLFVEKFGFLNERVNRLAFQDDVENAIVTCIEIKGKDGTYKKGDIFSKRTIQKPAPITHVDDPVDALRVCIDQRGRVDLDHIANLCGKPAEEMESLLGAHIFREPSDDLTNPVFMEADEYLSGNVVQKLEAARYFAKEYPDFYERNVKALEAVQPVRLEAADINVQLSSSWLGEEMVNLFIWDLFRLSKVQRENPDSRPQAKYDQVQKEWWIENKRSVTGSIISSKKYGSSRMEAIQIIQQILNQRQVAVYDAVPDPDGGTKPKYVYNEEESTLVKQKKALIEEAFQDWVFADMERREFLVDKYNRLFNNSVLRKFNGAHLSLPGMTNLISLQTHQINAVARIRACKSVLLHHVVGAGKTFTMIVGGMELLRLGKATKLLYAVPNHLTEQFGKDFLLLYPNASVLVATEKDFTKEERRKFLGKIATSSVQAVIMGHSQFERIEITPERKQKEIQHELDCLDHAIRSAQLEDSYYTVKRLEQAKKSLEERLKRLLSGVKKDAVLYFEQLGVDGLFVDECHEFKNGALHSKMGNIAGVPSTSSLKAEDMLAKVRYLHEIQGCCVFASGTPISNSIAEMYVFQRYLEESTLIASGITHFDEWASTFGKLEESVELKPEGKGYRTVTRFSSFCNIPELMSIYLQVADVQTEEMLNLPKPKVRGGKPEVVVSPPTADQLLFMDDAVRRAERIRSGAVNSSEDNMLKLTSDAKKIATDPRLYDPSLSNNPEGKIEKCAHKVLKEYREHSGLKAAQLVFSDIGTPKEDRFNVYHELRRQLVDLGIPEDEIAFIHDAKTKAQTEEIFAKVRSGAVRLLIGSTQKCGAGTNIQERLAALHELDCPWRPNDIEQREGRILRPGNLFDKVPIYRYITEKTFDAYLWQVVEQKQRFISQLFAGKFVGRTCKDIDATTLNYAEVKAIGTGDPRFQERIQLETDVGRLRILKRQHQHQIYSLQDFLSKTYPQRAQALNSDITKAKLDILCLKKHPEAPFCIRLGAHDYDERAKAGEVLNELLAVYGRGKKKLVGMYRGLSLSLSNDWYGPALILQNAGVYSCPAGTDAVGNIIRIENLTDAISKYLGDWEMDMKALEADRAEALKGVDEPFAQEDELREKEDRLIQLTAEINKDAKKVVPVSEVLVQDEPLAL